MDKEKNLPSRKSLRIKKYDYSSKGAYFITICIKDRQRILSKIIGHTVGGGAHDAPQIHMTEIGKIAKKIYCQAKTFLEYQLIGTLSCPITYTQL